MQQGQFPRRLTRPGATTYGTADGQQGRKLTHNPYVAAAAAAGPHSVADWAGGGVPTRLPMALSRYAAGEDDIEAGGVDKPEESGGEGAGMPPPASTTALAVRRTLRRSGSSAESTESTAASKECFDQICECLPRWLQRILYALFISSYQAIPPSVTWSVAYLLLSSFLGMPNVADISIIVASLTAIQWFIYSWMIYLTESPEYCAFKYLTFYDPMVQSIPDALADGAFVVTNFLGKVYMPSFIHPVLRIALIALGDGLGTAAVSATTRTLINYTETDQHRKRPVTQSMLSTGTFSALFTIIEALALISDEISTEGRVALIWLGMMLASVGIVLYFAPTEDVLSEEEGQGKPRTKSATTAPRQALPISAMRLYRAPSDRVLKLAGTGKMRRAALTVMGAAELQRKLTMERDGVGSNPSADK